MYRQVFLSTSEIFLQIDMSGPDFAGLLKEHKEKEAKAVLRAVGGDLGSVSTESSRDGKNIKHFWCHIWGAVLILGVLRYFKEHFLANLSRQISHKMGGW